MLSKSRLGLAATIAIASLGFAVAVDTAAAKESKAAAKAQAAQTNTGGMPEWGPGVLGL